MMNHNELPQMTEAFDRRVRETLHTLPEQLRRKRRFPLKRIAAIGVAAALCIGGTAFAASDLPQQLQRHFALLFHGSDEALLGDYAVTPAPGTLIDENDDFRVSVASVLFDESAGAGVISLRLENKRGDGVMPFSTIETLEQYKGDNLVWSDLAECTANRDGELSFDILFGQSDWCAGKFYLNKERSTDNTYYIEGAFIPAGSYTAADGPLRLEIGRQGEYTTDASGVTRLTPVLSLELPAFERMPYYRTKDGLITLSQIGLRVSLPDMHSVVDELDYIAMQRKDGATLVLMDEANSIDRTLYALGQSADPDAEGYDIGSYVFSQTFKLTDVQAIQLNDTTYPLSD